MTDDSPSGADDDPGPGDRTATGESGDEPADEDATVPATEEQSPDTSTDSEPADTSTGREPADADADAQPDESTADAEAEDSTGEEQPGESTAEEATEDQQADEAAEEQPASQAGDDDAERDQAQSDQVESDQAEGSEAEGDEAERSQAESDADTESQQQAPAAAVEQSAQQVSDVPPDVQKYDRFKKIDGGTYDRANEFLRDRTYITAREWAIARLCADFRTETGVEMTKIGENLPELVPFMTDTYTPQAVNQARASFEEKVRKAGATFLYGAMCDFFTAEELDDVMYEATEVAKFLLEVEGVELSVEEELAAEDEISDVMRRVREHSAALRHDHVECPDCGHHFEATAEDAVDED